MRHRAAAAVLLVAALACQHGGPGSPRPTGAQTRFLDRLSSAIDGVNAARKRIAGDARALGTAAAALDDVDAIAVTGDRSAVRNARPAAARAMTAATPAAGRIGADVQAYDAALTALAGAGREGLDAEQAAALDGVVTAGRAEVVVLRSYGTVVTTVWPRYAGLDEAQKTWLARASNGWYRTQQEAAGNYVVFVD
ncbi:MAG TPA: hypothetical protein VFQ85_01265, partial [Mycobacteriales bacterium]|nr:hypothetical protein [Mycobacteriales bacterium]